MLLGSSHVGFLIHDKGQNPQWMGKYLVFCPTKKRIVLIHILALIIDYAVSMNI